MTPSNQREFFRLDLSAGFWYQSILVGSNTIQISESKAKSHIYNISGGGLLFSVSNDTPTIPNEYIYGELLLTENSDPIPFLGKPVRRFPHPIDPDRCLIALHFIEISIPDQDKIVEYINRKVISP
ncbi:MAG: PilZ domain-containing protein [Candidatus Delongbacteria bacterium]|nr:PilZ domain-containing protein [Candidatus Delongbacteria bacterium]